MSTDRPPLDDLDLSAYLDGEDDGDVSARLESEPGGRERLDQLRVARDAVAGADVVALSDDQVDSIVAVAMAVDADNSSDDGHPVAPVPISRRSSGPPMWAVAAVVLALVGIGLTLVWSGRDTGDDDVAFTEIGASISDDESADSSSDGDGRESSTASEMAPEASAGTDVLEGDSELSTTTAPVGGNAAPTLVYLGEFSDADALREHLRAAFPTDGAGPLPDTGVTDDLTAAFRCLGKVDGLFTSGEPTDVGLADVDGSFVVVYDMPYQTDQGRNTTLVIAVDEISCTPVLTFQR